MSATIVRRVRIGWVAVLATAALGAAGCSVAYTTPGSGMQMDALARGDIKERLDRRPAANFPANLAVARVQGSGYRSYTQESYGEGRYSVVTTRDIEKQADFERIAKMPRVAGVAPVSRLLLPERLNSDEELRVAAASLRADMLLVYTFDTSFATDESLIAPLRLFYLALLPDQKTKITTTASAAIFDVRTGFVYGAAEATAHEEHVTSLWSNSAAVDQSRQQTEREAFDKLLGEIETTWAGVVRQHGGGEARLTGN
jgi:hypothetical protein